MISRCEAEDENGAIICLDQEKAYDKITHTFLWASLNKLGFPDHFTNTVKSLYKRTQTKILINGEYSTLYAIVQGVHQGDPLSCLLFNIAIESLAALLRASPLAGFNIPGLPDRLLLTLFVDDTTIFLSSNDSYETLQAILRLWCQASGAKFNINKTVILPTSPPVHRASMLKTHCLNPNHSPIPDGVQLPMMANQYEPWAPL